MSIGDKGSHLVLTDEIKESLEQLVAVYSNYISRYVEFMNNLIGMQRRVSTLRFERMTLIKYVKKLRFMNDILHSWKVELSGSSSNDGMTLREAIDPLGSYLIKLFEVLDLLNFYITQPLRGETISKTLNEDLVLSEETIECINETYRVYVKGIQWLVESIGGPSEGEDKKYPHLVMELVEFARKCAIEDGVDMTNSEDILLQDVAVVDSGEEFHELLCDWTSILGEKGTELKELFNQDSTKWASVTKKK